MPALLDALTQVGRVLNLNLMIVLHRLNEKEFVLNCDLIKYVEATPDTMLTLMTGEKIMVRESVEQVLEETKRYKSEIFGLGVDRLRKA
jgi:flagellar protein FlbD